MIKKLKKVLLVIVAAFAVLAFSSCDENREDIRIGLVTTDEGLSNYITSLTRSQISTLRYNSLKAQQTSYYVNTLNKSFSESIEKKWKKAAVNEYTDFSIADYDKLLYYRNETLNNVSTDKLDNKLEFNDDFTLKVDNVNTGIKVFDLALNTPVDVADDIKDIKVNAFGDDNLKIKSITKTTNNDLSVTSDNTLYTQGYKKSLTIAVTFTNNDVFLFDVVYIATPSEYTETIKNVSNNYEKVKTTYVLFSSDNEGTAPLAEIESAFQRSKNSLDVAFLSVAELNKLGHKFNMTGLQIVYIDTIGSTGISGFWVMKKSFIEKCNSNAKKFIASLVQSGIYCEEYLGTEVANYDSALSQAQGIARAKETDPEYANAKWIYETVNFFSCSDKQTSFSADVEDFKDKLDPLYYLTVLDYGFSDYEDLKINPVAYNSYTRETLDCITAFYRYDELIDTTNSSCHECLYELKDLLEIPDGADFKDYINLTIMNEKNMLYFYYATLDAEKVSDAYTPFEVK